MDKLNKEVSEFLDALNHPLRDEIENLSHIIINSTNGLTENIKWNGPNYCYENNDCITMKIQPPKQIQLIFHRGAKKHEQPKEKMIQSKSKFLLWKENDRAILSFKNRSEIEDRKTDVTSIIKEWILKTK